MAHVLHSQPMHRRTLDGIIATLRAIVRAVTAEHTAALSAATKAASPRRSLAEVRAMYVATRESQEGGDVAGNATAGSQKAARFKEEKAAP